MPKALTSAAISVATKAIGSKIAGSVIDNAVAKLDQLISNATIRLSNVGQDLIAQIGVSIEELRIQLADDLNKTVAELEDTLKVQLYNLTVGLDKLLAENIEQLDDLTETMVRDFRSTLSRTWFMSEIYALDGVDNTLIPAGITGDWLITASGLNLGYDSQKIESVVHFVLEVPGQDEFKVLGAELSKHTVEFTVPKELIEGLRQDSEPTILNARLHTKIKKDGFLFFNKKFKGIHRFKVTIAPKIWGELSTQTIVPKLDWVRNDQLDIVYSNNLPSGHATSSSKVQHHRITRNFSIPRASVPPKLMDRRFYSANGDGCTGAGCGHLHELKIKILNNGSTLNVFTYNNSHEITVRIRGKVERFEEVDQNVQDTPPQNFLPNSIIQLEFPAGFKQATISGFDRDHGLIDLIIDRDITTNVYPLPTGKWGGLTFLGAHVQMDKVIYRFTRQQ